MEGAEVCMNMEAIGGYLELELPPASAWMDKRAIGYQAARKAFQALLRSGQPRRVWLPRYTCTSLIDTLETEGIEFAFYAIDEQLQLAGSVSLSRGEWLLYINYFGVRDAYARQLLRRFDPDSVVIDCSQSLFSPPFDCLATLYSPRKFVGVPDGGLLITRVAMPPPQEVDDGSIERLSPLLKRIAFSAESGYQEHHQVDRSLSEGEPMRMSVLTSHLLSRIHAEHVRACRIANFSLLHRLLGRHNRLDLGQVPPFVAPMCYPLLTTHAGLRAFLISRRIFVPRYWSDLDGADARFETERSLSVQLTALPCDQRYGESHMRRIAQACNEFLEAAC